MRRAVIDLRKLSKLKSLFCFFAFYATFVTLSTIRMDYWHGHETLTWLTEAHSHAGVEPMTHAEELTQITDYLDGSLADVVSELKRICTNCEVGLTPKQRDMTFLGLDDFICSDFDSTVGQRHYPSRNCPLEDAAWAASPSSLTAPCCSNATLVRGSVAMMTESIAYGITELPLTRLLGGGSDPSYSSTEYFVNHYVETKAFILQLIVSRDQRMAGIEYYVGKHKTDAPNILRVLPQYWSFNYAADGLEDALFIFMCVAGAMTLAHDRRLMVEHFFGDPELKNRLVQRGSRGSVYHLPWWHWLPLEVLEWSKRWSLYVTLIEIPSVLLPMLFEVMLPFLQLPTWTFWIAFSEMVLSIRLLHEGTLAPALKRLVAVFDEATPNMIALVVVLIPLTALTSLMHSQLFGLFDDGFSDPFVSLSRVVNMLTAPPPAANTEGEKIESQEGGAELLFYWSTVVIRLCFGSFIVAILVGAFNKVVASEAAVAADAQRDASLPPGYVDASERTSCGQFGVFCNFFATARLYGSYEPRLLQALETQIRLTELADASGGAKSAQLMVNAAELAELVGTNPAIQLLRSYGAAPASQATDKALDA